MYTLWFERITDEKNSIFKLIGDIEKGIALSDEVIQAVDQQYIVRDFSQLIQKINPTIYLTVNYPLKQIVFSRNKDEINKTEKVELYRTEGGFEQLDNWISDLHSGLMLPLDESEKRDWFYLDMLEMNEEFNSQRDKLVESSDMNLISRFLSQHDSCSLLLRRFVYIDSMIEERRILPITQKKGKIRLIGSKSMMNRYMHSQSELFGKKIKAILSEGTFANKELLYWNCMMDICADELRDNTYYKEQREIFIKLYSDMMESFWKVATPLLHSMFEIKKHLEKKETGLIITNCSANITTKEYKYLERFVETVNTKSDKSYMIENIYIPVKKRTGNVPINISRERFKGHEINTDIENEEISDLSDLKVPVMYQEEQMEDIYEFFSRNR